MSDTMWNIVGSGAAVLAAIAARKALTSGWEAATGTEPPDNPADPAVEWKQAIAWGMLTGAVVGVARMLASRETAKAAQRVSGRLPDDARREAA